MFYEAPDVIITIGGAALESTKPTLTGMEHGYYVHSPEAGVHVSGGGNGLAQSLCAVVGAVEQPGQRILREGAGGGIEAG